MSILQNPVTPCSFLSKNFFIFSITLPHFRRLYKCNIHEWSEKHMKSDEAIKLLADPRFLDKLYAYAYRHCSSILHRHEPVVLPLSPLTVIRIDTMCHSPGERGEVLNLRISPQSFQYSQDHVRTQILCLVESAAMAVRVCVQFVQKPR